MPNPDGSLTDAEFEAEAARRQAANPTVPLSYPTEAAQYPPPPYRGPSGVSETPPPALVANLSTTDQAELDRLTKQQAALVAIGGVLSPADTTALNKLKAKSTAAKNPKPDKYYAVKTGDTLDSIAKELGHEGEGQALFDHAHDGGVGNGEQIANHDNLIRGANGEAVNERGALVPVIDKTQVTTKTKLVEGLSLLLPKGW